jgi:hypothetical protein
MLRQFFSVDFDVVDPIALSRKSDVLKSILLDRLHRTYTRREISIAYNSCNKSFTDARYNVIYQQLLVDCLTVSNAQFKIGQYDCKEALRNTFY